MSDAAKDAWLLLDSGACDYAYNMALDEALMECAPELQCPVLRFYGWREAAASFGYSQKISEIEKATRLRPLVRRTTGGGLVPHDADWTYSVTVPPGHRWYSLRAPDSYERMHRWIQSAFATLSIATELAPVARHETPGQCFAGYEQSDVLRLGKKIAGAAQRRTRTALLIQGSIQPPPSAVFRPEWQTAMTRSALIQWNSEFQILKPSSALAARAEALAKEKFSQDGHNRRR